MNHEIDDGIESFTLIIDMTNLNATFNYNSLLYFDLTLSSFADLIFYVKTTNIPGL